MSLGVYKDGAVSTVYEQKMKYGSLFSVVNRAGHAVYYSSKEDAVHAFNKMEGVFQQKQQEAEKKGGAEDDKSESTSGTG